MAYNLIEEAWIPALREGRQEDLISPWQITEKNPPLKVASPRPDFCGSLTEFLIGLVQTCIAPRNEREWRKMRDTPPDPDTLHNAFGAHSDAFLLDGDGPRFMQDLTLTPEEAGEPVPIGSLLIESPGANTITHNADLFIKRGGVNRLCPACAAAALFTLQGFAPSGGAGNRTSLRGGGPLTTLVLGSTLWETVWNNILTEEFLNGLGGNHSLPTAGSLYPWLAKTRTSTKGEEVFLGEVHPLHKYWGMPRRIRFVFSNSSSAPCDLCNQESGQTVTGLLARPRGYNYAGSWMHPLSPIREMNEQLLAVKGSSDGLAYQNWLGLVYREVNQKNPVQAAPVIRYYRENRVEPGHPSQADFRIWAYGYDMDNMKARAWCEGIMPAWAVTNDEAAKRLAIETSHLIECAKQAHDVLQWALKTAFFSDFMKDKKQATYKETVSARFWSETRGEFFNTLSQLIQSVRQSEKPQHEIRLAWLGISSNAAKAIFNHLTEAESLMVSDPKAYAEGWNILRNSLSAANKKIIMILDLPLNKTEKPTNTEGGDARER